MQNPHQRSKDIAAIAPARVILRYRVQVDATHKQYKILRSKGRDPSKIRRILSTILDDYQPEDGYKHRSTFKNNSAEA